MIRGVPYRDIAKKYGIRLDHLAVLRQRPQEGVLQKWIEDHGRAPQQPNLSKKLTDDEVFEILERSQTESAASLAKEFGVSVNQIFVIKRGDSRRSIFEKWKKTRSGSTRSRSLRKAAPDIRKLFDKVARLQRGAPEEAMLRATKFYGGGVLPNLLEHVGDLIHRMTESVMFNTGGYEAVSEKVFMALRTLQRPYGFAREEAEQRASNAADDGMSVEEFSAKLQPLLDRYVAEHKKLPTYNRAQSLAQQAAVALGSGRYEECEKALLHLKRRLGDWEVWTAFAHLFGDAADSNPELDTARRLGTRCLSLCTNLLKLKVNMDAIVYSFPELEEDYDGDPPRVILHKFLLLAFQYFHQMGNLLDAPIFEVPDFRATEDPQTIEEAERLLDHYFYDARNLLRGFSPLLEGLSEMWSISGVDHAGWFKIRSDLFEIKLALGTLKLKLK